MNYRLIIDLNLHLPPDGAGEWASEVVPELKDQIDYHLDADMGERIVTIHMEGGPYEDIVFTQP